jgi:hypothetical protein
MIVRRLFATLASLGITGVGVYALLVTLAVPRWVQHESQLPQLCLIGTQTCENLSRDPVALYPAGMQG